MYSVCIVLEILKWALWFSLKHKTRTKILLFPKFYMYKDQLCTVDSRYLEDQRTLWNISRYPYLDISGLQNWGNNKSNNQVSQMNMKCDSWS